MDDIYLTSDRYLDCFHSLSNNITIDATINIIVYKHLGDLLGCILVYLAEGKLRQKV